MASPDVRILEPCQRGVWPCKWRLRGVSGCEDAHCGVFCTSVPRPTLKYCLHIGEMGLILLTYPDGYPKCSIPIFSIHAQKTHAETRLILDFRAKITRKADDPQQYSNVVHTQAAHSSVFWRIDVPCAGSSARTIDNQTGCV